MVAAQVTSHPLIIMSGVTTDPTNSGSASALLDEVAQDLGGDQETPNPTPNEVRLLQTIVNSQREQLLLLQERTHSRRPSPSPSQAVKAPPIPAFSGSNEERSSIKVKGFIYNVRKVGALSSMSEPQMLALAECHLQAVAANWMMRLEQTKTKPATLEQLESLMIKEFVPSDERARARMKLITLHMKTSVDAHLTQFQELLHCVNMPLSEVYLFLFLSLPPAFKEELTKKFPTGEPKGMTEVYEFIRTLERSHQWARRFNRPDSFDSFTPLKKPTGTAPRGTSSPAPKLRERSKTKDSNLLSWGPAQKGERNHYRRNDRCFKCGNKGYSKGACDCSGKTLSPNKEEQPSPKE